MSKAKTVRIIEPPAEPPSGAFTLPPLESFGQPRPSDVGDATLGRVADLDYTKWAAAIIDLDSSPERITSQRARLHAKGYRQVDGQPLVGGFPNPEVWVIPRPLYEQNRERRKLALREAVARGDMYDSAVGASETVAATKTR